MCWQAENYGGARLKHWNWDGKGDHPEDWETFAIDPVSPAAQTVIIRNAAYGQFIHDSGSFDGDPPSYINLVGNNFSCNARKSNAVVLKVLFG